MKQTTYTPQNTPKPHIEKGFYTATLLSVEPRQKEGEFGRQWTMTFEIAGQANADGTPVWIRYQAYAEYKDPKSPTGYKTAITPKSKMAKAFTSLGWTFSPNLDTDQFVGRQCEVLVNDYQYEFAHEDGRIETLTASGIEQLNPPKKT